MENLPLITHFKELKNRLLFCVVALLINTCICYFYASEIYGFLVRPLAEITGLETRKMIYTGLTEAFFTYLKLAFFSGFILTIPIILSQIYGFLSPGLYKNEKSFLLPFLIASPLLFIAGAALVYYLVFPMAWQFFLSFETENIEGVSILLEARISEYLSLVIHLIMAFGLAFQLPIILTLLAWANIISAETLIKKRKIAIVIIFIIAAIITPPDVISQIALAIPMLVLYEISILAAKKVRKKSHA